MSFSESQLKSLKVSELKEKLTELSLSTVGKKEELIARILAAAPAEVAAATAGDDFDPLLAPPQDFDWNADETDSAAAPPPPPPAPAAPIAPATPSLAAVDKKLEESPAVVEPSTSAPPAAIPAPPAPTPDEAAAPAPAAPAAPVLTAEEKAAASAADIEKKKARAARFGVPYVEKSEPTVPRKATAVLPPGPKSTKAVVPTKPTTVAAAAASVVRVAAAPKKEVDPVEEEKKRKRAEKFGAVVPAEKKAKTD